MKILASNIVWKVAELFSAFSSSVRNAAAVKTRHRLLSLVDTSVDLTFASGKSARQKTLRQKGTAFIVAGVIFSAQRVAKIKGDEIFLVD